MTSSIISGRGERSAGSGPTVERRDDGRTLAGNRWVDVEVRCFP